MVHLWIWNSMKLDPKSFNMDNEKHIELINKIFQMNKPEGVDTLN